MNKSLLYLFFLDVLVIGFSKCKLFVVFVFESFNFEDEYLCKYMKMPSGNVNCKFYPEIMLKVLNFQ